MIKIPPEILADSRLVLLVKKHGLPDFSSDRKRIGAFRSLARSIISQQLSTKAAETIHNRFISLFSNKRPTPALVLSLSQKELRSVGLSQQKVSYIQDLSEKFIDGSIPLRSFSTMTNDEITEHLVRVKGIGEWTAHMFLIFSLNRLDVLPVGDLIIRKGFQKVYGLKSMPTEAQMEKLAQPWRKHATIVSWYLWREKDGDL